MPTIAEVRQQFPQYQDMPDAALADALHRKFYSDMPRADFDAKIGLAQGAAPVATPVAADPAALVQDPNIVKGSLLPLSRNRMTGETSFDMSAGIPGMVQQGIQKLTGGLQPQQPEVPGMLSEVDVARQQIAEQQKVEGATDVAALASPMSAGSRTAASVAAAGVKAAKPTLPEIEAIKEGARAAYKVADDAGVVVSKESFGPLVKDIASTVVK
jgi:hypothetical protein